jgi:hypothetical protein
MLEDIFKSKKQIRVYDTNKIPDKDLVEGLIKKAYAIAPSKQNLMPFKIHVLGPECKEEKKCLYEITTQTKANVMHNSAVFAPYVLIFTHRLVDDTNEAVLNRLEKGHPVQGVCDPNKFMNKGPFVQSSIEIGMYSSILSGLCLENKLEISFLKCFKSWYGKNDDRGLWKKLPFVRYSPLLLMCIGYRDQLKNWDLSHENEHKPSIDNIINFL